MPGFETVSVSAGYRLRATDEDGCNWSGEVVPMYGIRAPLATDIAAVLRPIVRAAQTRFNLSESVLPTRTKSPRAGVAVGTHARP